MTKRLIIMLCVSFLVAGCGGNSTNQKSSADTILADSDAGTKTPGSATENSNTISIHCTAVTFSCSNVPIPINHHSKFQFYPQLHQNEPCKL